MDPIPLAIFVYQTGQAVSDLKLSGLRSAKSEEPSFQFGSKNAGCGSGSYAESMAMAARKFLDALRPPGNYAVTRTADGTFFLVGYHRIFKRADGADRNPSVPGGNEAVLSARRVQERRRYATAGLVYSLAAGGRRSRTRRSGAAAKTTGRRLVSRYRFESWTTSQPGGLFESAGI